MKQIDWNKRVEGLDDAPSVLTASIVGPGAFHCPSDEPVFGQFPQQHGQTPMKSLQGWINEARAELQYSALDINIFITPFSVAQITSILNLETRGFLTRAKTIGAISSSPHQYDHIGIHKFFTVTDVMSILYGGPISGTSAIRALAFHIPESARLLFQVDLETLSESISEICADIELDSRQPASPPEVFQFLTDLVLLTGLFWSSVAGLADD